MRVHFVLVPLSLWATSAAAQEVAAERPASSGAIQLPPEIRDPATAERVAGAVQSLSQALLDIKIGGLEATLDGRKPTAAERNSTLGDLARRNDPDFDRHLQQRIASARPMIEQSIRAFSDALPEISRSLSDARRSVERAIANMPDPNYPKR